MTRAKSPQSQAQLYTLLSISEHIDTEGFAPTMRELGEFLGLTHRGAHDRVVKLERDGLVSRPEGRRSSRALSITLAGRRLLGRVGR